MGRGLSRFLLLKSAEVRKKASASFFPPGVLTSTMRSVTGVNPDRKSVV